MKFLVLLAGFLATSAFALEGSINAGSGYNFLHENTYVKGGLSLSQPIGLGLGWWSWYGVGMTAEDTKWASMSQAVDWSFKNVTTSFVYTVSKDPELFSDKNVDFEHNVGMNVKIKLFKL